MKESGRDTYIGERVLCSMQRARSSGGVVEKVMYDSGVDTQRGTGTQTRNSHVMLDIQHIASDQASLNSCTVQRENSKHRKKVVDFFIFSSSQHFSFVKFLRLLPFQSQYLLLVELMST